MTKETKKTLKNRKIAKLATRFVESERRKWTIDGAAEYVFDEGKVVWLGEDANVLKLQTQICEIARLQKNHKSLQALLRSEKVSVCTKSKIELYERLLSKAIKICEMSKGNEEFFNDLSMINSFVESHIVFRKMHKTFRVAHHKELECKYHNKKYVEVHRILMANEQLKTFDNILGEKQK